jgi:hypothetical protein
MSSPLVHRQKRFQRILETSLVVVAVFLSAHCGGTSTPSTPTTPPSTVPLIGGVSPTSLTARASSQTLTVNGSNFQSGLTLNVTPPSGSASTFSGSQIQSQTSTSFQVSVTLTATGSYAFQVANPNGDRSNVLAVTVQAVATPTWIPEGARLTDVTAGFPGSVLANASAFKLNDGRWRLLFTLGSSIRSAVSTDGLSLTMEAGTRVGNSGDCGHVRAFRLDDGRIRVYCRNPSGILSYISSDEGVTLSPESGSLMIPNGAVGASRLSTGGIVRTHDGRWRMYFSDEIQATGVAPPMRIFSATSSDLLTWSVEPGVRIGLGATASGSGTHPSAIANPDGSVSVFYTGPTGVWVATSSDGLTFTSDSYTGLSGFDPDVVSAGSGLRVYYNFGNDAGGTIFSATGTAASASLFLDGAGLAASPLPIIPRSPGSGALGPATPVIPLQP